MPTNKPRLSVVLDENELNKIEHYRYINGISSLSKAATELILKGLARFEGNAEPLSPYSGDEMNLMRVFRKSDAESRTAILRAVANAKPAGRQGRIIRATDEEHRAVDIDDIKVILDYYQYLSTEERERFILKIKAAPDVDAESFDSIVASAEEKVGRKVTG